MSADVAAMAPGTRTGAASPVIAIGGFTIGVDEVLRRKIMNDAMAFLRSYTEKRGRNAKLAETAGHGCARVYREGSAGREFDRAGGGLAGRVTAQLDGRTVARFDGSKATLKLTNYQRGAFELSARQKFLSRIVEPDMFFPAVDSGYARPVCGDLRIPERDSGSRGSDLFGSGALRYASLAGEYRRRVANPDCCDAVCAGGKVYEPRSLVARAA
jgi:hypothetical protein